MRNLNIGNNEIKKPTPINNEVITKKETNNHALLYLLAIPFIIGALFLGNYILNKSNSFFMNKRNEMVQEQIDEHTKKDEEKNLIVPMKFIDDKNFVIEYKKNFSKHSKSLSSLIDYQEGSIVYLTNPDNKDNGYYLKTDILIFTEYNNNYTIIETIEDNNYFILKNKNNKYLLFQTIYKERLGETGIDGNKYYGLFISNLKDNTEFNNIDNLRKVLDTFNKEIRIYTCNNNLDTCLNKIDSNKTINYLDYK